MAEEDEVDPACGPGDFTPLRRGMRGPYLATAPTDEEMLEVEHLDATVRTALLEALGSGPAESVLDRVDFTSLRMFGALSALYVRNTREQIARVEASAERAVAAAEASAQRTVAGIAALAGIDGIDPTGWFVYLLRTEKTAPPLYIGMSGNILRRLGTHMGNPDRRHRVRHVSVIRCASEAIARKTEAQLIREHRPELNIAGVA